MRPRGSSHLILTFAVVAGAVASARPAAAQPTGRVLVLPLASDFLSEPLLRQLEEEMREEVASAMPKHIILPRPALDLASMKVAAGCATDGPECLALIGRTTRAEWVVQVSLLGNQKRAMLLVRRVRSRKPTETPQYETELSDVGRASSKELRWHIATALGAQPPPLMGRISLQAGRAGALSGVTVLLDDRPIRKSDLHHINPGRHRIEVRREGFEPFVWMGVVRPGRATPIRVRLNRNPPPGRVSSDAVPPEVLAVEESSGPLWTWILGAGAVVAAGTATVFGVQVIGLESDAESRPLDCNGMDENADLCVDGRNRALMANITWGVAGALAVGAVIAYFVESDSDSDDTTTATQFGISPTDGGVAAGVLLSF